MPLLTHLDTPLKFMGWELLPCASVSFLLRLCLLPRCHILYVRSKDHKQHQSSHQVSSGDHEGIVEVGRLEDTSGGVKHHGDGKRVADQVESKLVRVARGALINHLLHLPIAHHASGGLAHDNDHQEVVFIQTEAGGTSG